MKLIRSKDYVVNGRRITMELCTGRGRSHGKWVSRKYTITRIEGISNGNLDFSIYNDFGNVYATFSIEYLTPEERKVVANGNEELLNMGLNDCDLVNKSGLVEDVEKVYSDWYGIEI